MSLEVALERKTVECEFAQVSLTYSALSAVQPSMLWFDSLIVASRAQAQLEAPREEADSEVAHAADRLAAADAAVERLRSETAAAETCMQRHVHSGMRYLACSCVALSVPVWFPAPVLCLCCA